MTRRNFLTAVGTLAAAAALPPISAQAQEGAKIPEHIKSPRIRGQLEALFVKPSISMPKEDPRHPEESKYFKERVEGWRQHYVNNARDRDRLAQGFERLLADDGKHLQLVRDMCEKEGVPFEMVFLALAESHWSAFGENGAKAAGYWQFIPGTGKQYGLQNVPVTGRTKRRYSQAELLKMGDGRLDAEASTTAAIKYLKYLRNFFETVAVREGIEPMSTQNDLWAYAMWAYNRGAGHVKKSFIKQGGRAIRYSHHLIEESNSPARRESANYVPKIWGIRLALMEILNLPGVPHREPQIAEKKETPDGARTKRTPERVPRKVSAADQKYGNLPESPGNTKEDVANYIDQLREIRELYKKEQGAVHSKAYTIAALAIIDEKLVAVQKEFPEFFSIEAGPLSTHVDDQGDVVVDVDKSKKKSEKAPTKTEVKEISDVIEYMVQPGDTLDKIATWLSSEDDPETIRDVKRTIQGLNPRLWKRPDVLRLKESIRVPAEHIVVRRGDTLDKIAKEYYDGWDRKVAINMLKWLNGITPAQGTIIRPGQKLRVPAI